jgi:RNA-directed DNA polymerase
MAFSLLVEALARAFLRDEPDVDQQIARASRVLGEQWRWLRPLAERYVATVAGKRPRYREAMAFLRRDVGLQRAYATYRHRIHVVTIFPDSEEMRPVSAAIDWDVPSIRNEGDLGRWLGLELNELYWFADVAGFGARPEAPPKTRHYSYRILTKRSGSLRLIEAPKRQLKAIQRRILSGILEQVPTHAAAHGFVSGRSIKSFAEPHVARDVVLKLDLQDFFPSFQAARIQALFRTIGYPECVADLLAGICCTSTPRELWKDAAPLHVNPEAWRESRDRYFRTHLPQGAPTSPALANICSYRMDCRLAGLAKVAGATYTRYADDLAFSGDRAFARGAERFAAHAAAILLEEGFSVNFHKTRVMRQIVRQRLTGLVVNDHPNVPRDEFDRLKATLTNCFRHGAESQNRENLPHWRAHLDGRVGFVESVNPPKGARLRKIFDRIGWA